MILETQREIFYSLLQNRIFIKYLSDEELLYFSKFFKDIYKTRKKLKKKGIVSEI